RRRCGAPTGLRPTRPPPAPSWSPGSDLGAVPAAKLFALGDEIMSIPAERHPSNSGSNGKSLPMPGQFSTALRHFRSQRGLSLRQFSQVVHYSPGWLSRIERGQAAPTLALARSCDDALTAGGKLLELARLETCSRLRPAQLPSAVAGFVGRTD